MGSPDPTAVIAWRAVEPALERGDIDLLQAEAIVALAAGPPDLDLAAAARVTLRGDLSRATGAVLEATARAAERLEDDAAGADLEELAGAVSRVLGEIRRLAASTYDSARPSPIDAAYASERWHARVEAAARHLKEAHDLLDDGMPPDSAAFEVLAARDRIADALRKRA